MSNLVRADFTRKDGIMATVEVLDSFMSYRDAGAGDIPVAAGGPCLARLAGVSEVFQRTGQLRLRR